jgi:ribonuclease HI
VIYDASNKILRQIGKYVGVTTNNQAEYKALITGLEEAEGLEAEEVICHLDSELVVRQMQGKYKVREEGLKDLAMQALRLTSKFKRVEFVHVRREKNKLADKLVNQALDEQGIR